MTVTATALRWICVALVAAAATAPAAAAQAPARIGPVQLGAALNDGGFDAADSRYRATFRDNFDAVTPESAFKMTETEPTRGQYSFALQNRMLDWAETNGEQFHGHTLVWCADEWNPTWLTQAQWTQAELTAVLKDYIDQVVGRYRGRIRTWDVVNEAFNANGSRRDCVWSRVLGPGYIETALRMAHDADPTAKLFYNEYNADLVNSRFGAVEAMAKDFRDRGVPLDGIGLQMHLFGPSPPQYRIEEAMARIGSLGLSVHVSELDDKTSAFLAPTTAERLAREAQAYQTVAAACQAQPACFRITTWGLTDAWSFRGPDELALAWDADYQAKPAWYALRRALRRDPPPANNRPPGVAGAPVADASPNRGAFTLRWPAASDPDPQAVTYALDRRLASGTSWTRVASGIQGTSYSFAADQFAQYPEAQGCWHYRVVASDGWAEAGGSAESSSVLVDRGAASCTPPAAPTEPDPVPEPEPQGGESAPPGPGAPVAAAGLPAATAHVPVALTLKASTAIGRTTLRRTGLRVTLACSTRCRVTLRLARGAHTLARRSVTAGPATKALRLRARTSAGAITLRITAPGVTPRTKRVRVGAR